MKKLFSGIISLVILLVIAASAAVIWWYVPTKQFLSDVKVEEVTKIEAVHRIDEKTGRKYEVTNADEIKEIINEISGVETKKTNFSTEDQTVISINIYKGEELVAQVLMKDDNTLIQNHITYEATKGEKNFTKTYEKFSDESSPIVEISIEAKASLFGK